VREKNMKNYSKYSILIALALLMTIPLTYAAVPPAQFGVPPQPTGPKECSPKHYAVEPNLAAYIGPPVGVSNPALSIDGFFSTGPTVITTFDSLTSDPANTWFAVGTVSIPGGAPAWNPGWVEIKIHFAFTPSGGAGDFYRFQISLDNATWTDITADSNAAATERNFQLSQVSRPGGGSWTWADISNLNVRVYFSQNPANGAWDGDTFNFYEAWVDVYSLPKPSGTNILTLQPGNITVTTATGTGALLIYEVYASGFTKLWGYQFRIDFNKTVLKANSVWTYAPWVSQSSPDVLDNTNGYVAMSYYTFAGDPNGFTGSAPLARIYFQRLLSGTTYPKQYSPLNFNFTLGQTSISDPQGGKPSFNAINGFYGVPPALPEFPLGTGIVMMLAPAIAIAFVWRTRRKGTRK
jgi:hypothetical protein